LTIIDNSQRSFDNANDSHIEPNTKKRRNQSENKKKKKLRSCFGTSGVLVGLQGEYK
jgi:hypothetical protein